MQQLIFAVYYGQFTIYEDDKVRKKVTRGPFLKSPGNLTGPVSYFEIKVSRKECCVLTSNKVHFVSLANNYCTISVFSLGILGQAGHLA